MDARAASAGTWDAQAHRYRTQERLEARAIAAALDLAAVRREERLVDLGTGTALLLRCLAERPAPPGGAIGIDRSEGMLAAAGDLPAGWRLERGDARDTGLADGCADVVSAAYLLHVLDEPDRRAALREAHRLLAPGPTARIVTVTVWTRSGGVPGAVGRVLSHLARRWPARLGGLAPCDPTADLLAAGFAVERRLELPRHGYPSLVLLARREARTPTPVSTATSATAPRNCSDAGSPTEPPSAA